jgi:hypothetical protein
MIPGFQSEQAVPIARAFDEEGVDYLFIGKSVDIVSNKEKSKRRK